MTLPVRNVRLKKPWSRLSRAEKRSLVRAGQQMGMTLREIASALHVEWHMVALAAADDDEEPRREVFPEPASSCAGQEPDSGPARTQSGVSTSPLLSSSAGREAEKAPATISIAAPKVRRGATAAAAPIDKPAPAKTANKGPSESNGSGVAQATVGSTSVTPSNSRRRDVRRESEGRSKPRAGGRPAPQPAGADELHFAPIHFEASGSRHCRWPMWDELADYAEKAVCGCPRVPGSPYCTTHAAMAAGVGTSSERRAVSDLKSLAKQEAMA